MTSAFAAVGVLLQLAATLLGAVTRNPDATPEQKAAAYAFVQQAISAGLQVLQQQGGTVAVAAPTSTEPGALPVPVFLPVATSPEVPTNQPKPTSTAPVVGGAQTQPVKAVEPQFTLANLTASVSAEGGVVEFGINGPDGQPARAAKPASQQDPRAAGDYAIFDKAQFAGSYQEFDTVGYANGGQDATTYQVRFQGLQAEHEHGSGPAIDGDDNLTLAVQIGGVTLEGKVKLDRTQ